MLGLLAYGGVRRALQPSSGCGGVGLLAATSMTSLGAFKTPSLGFAEYVFCLFFGLLGLVYAF